MLASLGAAAYPMGMTHRRCLPRHLIALTWAVAMLGIGPAALAAASGSGNPPKGPSATEQAVALYEQGHWAAAQAAFERLAAKGVPAADYNLGVMHLRKELPEASMLEGLKRLTRAAERGFVTAMITLAQLHERGDVTGRKDLAQAYRWNRKAAETGHVEAQVETGTAHYLGRGADKDMAQAAHWYREAAKQGETGAQYLLASMYEHGLGVQRDLRLARYWYEQCARAGDLAAPGKLREVDRKLAHEAGQ
jgi:TPR repeat protein